MRLPEVMHRIGMSRSRIYSLPGFPKQVRLGRNMSGWVESEVDAWIDARIRDRDSVAESGQQDESTLSP
ncbi:helix-turn-helix transcriptional regulator [Pseudomonas sp. Hp2]|uniref:helix-turn-helix transcriptional regulator n=1 Tax=Pseudomonas sp. Hp2 TaxID=701189 RepID=UPI001C499003|nr:AlpA family phage regulatory protein [Pseudomonas sp. Hp2]